MNCERCKTLLPPDARFCRVCGLPVSTPAPDGTVVNPPPFNQPTPPPVSPQQQWASPQWGQQAQELPPAAPQWGQQIQPTVPAAPQSYPSPLVISPSTGTMQSTGRQLSSPPAQPRRRGGCLPKILITLVIIVVLALGGWFIGLRPYLHSLVQNQIDQELSNYVNQILPVPPGINTFTITETAVNDQFVLNHSPSDPVQNLHMTIMPAGLQLAFLAYGFSCSVSAFLTTSNGVPVVNNVAIQGIVGLVMSPDELTTILNNHLSDAQARLHRSITSVTLREHAIDLTLGGITI